MNRASFKWERIAYVAGLVIVAWTIVTFLFVPLLTSFNTAFFRDNTFAVQQIASELISSNRVRTAIWNTLWMTALTTVTVTIIGVFQVLVLEYFHVRGRVILKIGFAVPLVFGSVVAAAGYNFTYGPNSALTTLAISVFGDTFPKDWFIGWFGVLYAHTFLMTSYHFLFLRTAMRRVDYSMVEVARSLGASEWTVVTRVILPVILPTLLAVTLLTVYTAISSFAAPQILGGRDFFMLSQIVLTLNSLRRPDMAALLALMMGVVVMALILWSQRVEERGTFTGGAKTSVPIEVRHVSNPLANITIHALTWLLWLIYVMPVALVVLFSFAPSSSIGVEILPSSLTLENYTRVLSGDTAGKPFFNSVLMGGIAVIAGLSLSLFAVPIMLKSRNWLTRFLDISFFLPWVVPSILLAVGLIAAFDAPNWLIGGGVMLGSFWILPIAYTIIILPLMVRFLRAAFTGIDPAYEEAARSLGAGGFYRFRRVILPIVAPTAILVAGMTFNDLMTEYPLSAFLYNVNNKPLPVAIVDGAVTPDPQAKAINLVYVTLIMAFSFVIILSAERIGLGRGPKINKL